jgi:hypothetical protein
MTLTSWLRRCARLDFALGVGLLLLLTSWWDSTQHTTWFACRWGPPHAHRGFGITTSEGGIAIWAGRPYQGLFGISWTGIRFDRAVNPPERRSFGPPYPGAIDLHIADRPTLGAAYWAVVLSYMAILAWFLRWRHLRAVRFWEDFGGECHPGLSNPKPNKSSRTNRL